jgi:hypothetical protein
MRIVLGAVVKNKNEHMHYVLDYVKALLLCSRHIALNGNTSVNDEFRKEAVVDYLNYCPIIFLEGLRPEFIKV